MNLTFFFTFLKESVLCVYGSSISHGVPSLRGMVGGPLVFVPRAPWSTQSLASWQTWNVEVSSASFLPFSGLGVCRFLGAMRPVDSALLSSMSRQVYPDDVTSSQHPWRRWHMPQVPSLQAIVGWPSTTFANPLWTKSGLCSRPFQEKWIVWLVSNASTFRFSSPVLCRFLGQLRSRDAAVLLGMLHQFCPGSRRVTLESQVNMFLNMFLWSSSILRAPWVSRIVFPSDSSYQTLIEDDMLEFYPSDCDFERLLIRESDWLWCSQT